MIVVDASAAVLALFNDGEARRMLSTEPLVAPHLIDVEIAHALRRQVRTGALEPAEAETCLATWQLLGIERVGVTDLLARVWEMRDNVSSYDAAYVALAEASGCVLLTGDARLAQAPGPRCTITVVRT